MTELLFILATVALIFIAAWAWRAMDRKHMRDAIREVDAQRKFFGQDQPPPRPPAKK